MVRRPAGGRRCSLGEQAPEVQLLDERVDRPHRVVFSDLDVQALRQQRHLISVTALHESGISIPATS